MRSARRWIVPVVLVVSACGSSGQGAGASSSAVAPTSTAAPTTSRPAGTTTAGSTTVAATTVPSAPSSTTVPTPSSTTVAATSTTIAPTTTAAPTCEPFGGTAAVGTGGDIVFSLTGDAIRIGRHDCYERIVFDLRGDGPFPSWTVAEFSGPFTNTEGYVGPGGAYLNVWIAASNIVEAPGTVLGYRSAWTVPSQAAFAGCTALRAVAWGSTGDEKDSSSWAVDIDRVRPFRVMILGGPPRLVVDVFTGD